MAETCDLTIANAVAYEQAALGALHAIDFGASDIEKIAACVRFVDALQAMEAMSKPDQYRSFNYVRERGLIPKGAWRRVQEAVESIAAARAIIASPQEG